MMSKEVNILPRISAHLLTVSIALLLLTINPAKARNFSFQPRLETGVMQYEFESEAVSRELLPAYNATISDFKFEDVMPFVSAGMTFFIDRLFLDISGQYAFDGDGRATLDRSGFKVLSVDVENQSISSVFTAMSSQSEVTFDRTDIAVSLGYAVTDNFSLFFGYKKSTTDFFEKFNGIYSINYHESADTDPDDLYAYGGRMMGSASFTFEYSGPFIGCIQGFDFSRSRFIKGVLTANVALAFLEGKLESKSSAAYGTTNWANDQQIPEFSTPGGDTNLSSRTDNAKGETLGLKVGLTWRGDTPWEGLTYAVGLSGYRYEFKSEEHISDMNETATTVKIGLTYLF